jgi:hypothetical protein
MKTDRKWERFIKEFWHLNNQPQTPGLVIKIRKLVRDYYQSGLFADHSCQP